MIRTHPSTQLAAVPSTPDGAAFAVYLLSYGRFWLALLVSKLADHGLQAGGNLCNAGTCGRQLMPMLPYELRQIGAGRADACWAAVGQNCAS